MNAPTCPPGVSREFHSALVARLDVDAFELPVLDENAARVVAFSANPAVDVDEAAEALESCEVLAERVLMVAASAFYATREPARDVRTACGRLGLRAVGELAIVALVRDRLYGSLIGSPREIEDLWRHAAVAGVFAYRLTRMRRRASEASMLAGLLADVGKPVVFALLAEIEAALGEQLPQEGRLYLVEAMHVSVGAALVSAWSLPKDVVLAVTYHHSFEQAPDDCEDAAIACLCDYLARRAFSASPSEEVIDHPAAKALNLTENEVDELLANADEIIEAARGLG